MVASMKNTMLNSAVGSDLGLGTTLPQQVQDNLAEEEARKKLLGLNAQSNVSRDLGLSPMNTALAY